MATINAAFWNCQNLFDTKASDIASDLEFTPAEGWTEEAYAAKVDNLAAIIKQIHGGAGPDLLGLCEVENKGTVEALLEKIGRADYRLAHVESPDFRGIDCSLVYSANVFNDPRPEDIVGHLVHFRYPTRDIFQVRLTLKETGDELIVFVNHWPSRSKGQFQTEPHRITVAERCGQLVNDALKFDRKHYVPDTEKGLEDLNKRWNRNVLVMGDFNDDPPCRSLTDYLLASKDLDKVEEELKPGKDRKTPALKAYLERQPALFNLSWTFLGTPDTGTIFFSSDSANTMNLFDQFIVSRGLYYGKSGLKARPGSVRIFTPKDMIAGNKPRPQAFDRKTKKGYSDHFPIEMTIDTVE